MFWVVDSLIMRKYKRLKVDNDLKTSETADGLPSVGDEETQVRPRMVQTLHSHNSLEYSFTKSVL